MEYGINLPVSSRLGSGAVIAIAARRAEELGFRGLWVGDHVVLPVESRSHYPYSPDGRFSMDVSTPWLDSILTLTWAAAATWRVTLGTSVLILPMRPTVLVAKQLATLDHLSGGRLVLGVGSGWLREEFELLGQPFERRGPRLEEAIEVLRACWGEGQGLTEFHGAQHQLDPFAFFPKPAQGSRVPILIGGASDHALRRVAELGDGWIPVGLDPDRFEARLELLDRELAAAGRRRADLRLVVQYDTSDGGFDPAVAARFEALGVDQLFTEINWRRNSLGGALDQMEAIAERAGLVGAGRAGGS